MLRTRFFTIIVLLLGGLSVLRSAAAAQQGGSPPDLRIHLKAVSFDPLEAPPKIRPSLRLAEPDEATAHQLIQFTRPLTRQDVELLRERYGLQIEHYVPNLAYLEKVPAETLEQLRELDYFRWAGPYQPAYKIDPEIGKRTFVSEERRAESGILLMVIAFEDAAAEELARSVKELGFEVVTIVDEPEHRIVRLRVRVDRPEDAAAIARLPAVKYIEEVGDLGLNNGTTSWVVQTNVMASRTVWDHGLRGEGQIIGHIDGALDLNHCFFRDSTDNTVRPAHRKVVGLRNSSGGTVEQAHGTFSAGNAAGEDFNNDADSATPNADNGNAPRARLTHGYLPDLGGSSSFFDYLYQAFEDGASIHTNSWDDWSTSDYTQLSVDLDRFVWENEDNLVIIGPYNYGVIKAPDTSKNALVVNSTLQAPNQGDFSSGITQFTQDGRRKPDLMAPGDGIVSADDGTACGTRTDGGTSFAAPAVAGLAALTRQYYTEGWYPSGSRQPHHAFVPSGALLKATLLNATVDATGIAGYPGGAADGEGWGRVLLENGLFFAGDARNLTVWDMRHPSGLAHGESDSYSLPLAAAGQALKITLVWNEPPATAGSLAPVTNDLDLVVTAPDGTTTFRGNDFAAGQSTTGGAADPLNNVEQVLINTPAVGTYTLTVSSGTTGINQGPQGYALVATGDFPEPPAPTGAQDTLVVRVKFQDVALTPPLPNLLTTMGEVVNYFTEVTYGQVTIQPDYLGPVDLDHPKDYYYHSERNLLIEMTEEVVAELVGDDSDVFNAGTATPNDDVDRLILVTNDVNFTEDWATTGPWPYALPGGITQPLSVSIQSYANGTARFTHGVGHQLGLVDLYAHPGVIFPRPYVDEWDNMAGYFNNAHFLAWSKERAQWITDHGSEITYVERPAAGSSYTGLNPIPLHLQESTVQNRKAIAIGLTPGATTLADEDAFYFIEARDNTLGGFDDALPMSGVLVYYVNQLIPQGEGPVIVLDKVLTSQGLDDAAFGDGDEHEIPGTGITFRVETGTGAAYHIHLTYVAPTTDYNVSITRGDTIDGEFYSYFSPDIWIDSPKDGWNLGSGPPPHDQIEPPVAGSLNRIYARIHNAGATSYDFDVKFRVSEPYHTVGGEADFDKFVDIKHIDSLADTSGSPEIVFVNWTPENDGDPHACVLVELINLKGTDTNEHDNWAQENLTKATSTTASPFTPVSYRYDLTNPYDHPALFYFRMRGQPPDWTVELVPRKVLLDPGERVEGVATVTPPPDAEVCTSEMLEVTSWTPRGDTLIPVGGAMLQVDLRRPSAVTLVTGARPCPRQVYAASFEYPDCRGIAVEGCTDPPRPFEEIIVKFVDALGNPVYHTVVTDENGCFEDFLVNPPGGIWQVEAEYPGSDCDAPAVSPGGVVLVPPRPWIPPRRLWYSFHVGASFPTGAFDQTHDPGPSLSLDLEYFLNERMALRGVLGFHYFHAQEDDLYYTNLSGHLRWYLPATVWRWFMDVGAGVYDPDSGGSDWGISLGAGWSFDFDPNLALEVAAQQHLIDPGDQDRFFLDLALGLRFRF